MREDVTTHLRGRRRGERRHLWTAEGFEHLAQPKIIGAKIVAPHRKAMRFVHREQCDRALTERFEKRPTTEAFRRDVNQFEFAASQRSNLFLWLGGRPRAVDERCRDPAARERVDL